MANYRVQAIYNSNSEVENYCVYKDEFVCVYETLSFMNYLRDAKKRDLSTLKNKATSLCYWYQYIDSIKEEADSFFTMQEQLGFVKMLENKTNFNRKKTIFLVGDSPYEVGLSGDTIQIHINNIKEYYLYLCNHGLTTLSPEYLPFREDLDIRASKKNTKLSLPETLSLSEVKAIIDACTSYRDKAIVLILVSTGLRVGELSALTLKSLDFKTYTIHLRKQYLDLNNGVLKTGERTVKGTKAMFTAIQKYLIFERGRVAKCDNLFVTLKSRNNQVAGMPLKRSSIIQMFTRLREKTGIGNCHAHILRHTFASNFLATKAKNDKVTIAVLQKLLGHKNINTTMIYAHLDYSLDDFKENRDFEELINEALSGE